MFNWWKKISKRSAPYYVINIGENLNNENPKYQVRDYSIGMSVSPIYDTYDEAKDEAIRLFEKYH